MVEEINELASDYLTDRAVELIDQTVGPYAAEQFVDALAARDDMGTADQTFGSVNGILADLFDIVRNAAGRD